MGRIRGLTLLLLVSTGAGGKKAQREILPKTPDSPPTRAEISDAVQRVLDRTSAQFNMSFQFGSVATNLPPSLFPANLSPLGSNRRRM